MVCALRRHACPATLLSPPLLLLLLPVASIDRPLLLLPCAALQSHRAVQGNSCSAAAAAVLLSIEQAASDKPCAAVSHRRRCSHSHGRHTTDSLLLPLLLLLCLLSNTLSFTPRIKCLTSRWRRINTSVKNHVLLSACDTTGEESDVRLSRIALSKYQCCEVFVAHVYTQEFFCWLTYVTDFPRLHLCRSDILLR